MPTVVFTQNLRRHIDCPDQAVDASTVADALAAVFAINPRLRSYVLDDQGALRHHMMVFVDGEPITDRAKLSDAVRPTSELYVMQALSGG